MAKVRASDGESTAIYKELSSGRTARFDQKLVYLLTRSAQVFAEQGYERTSIRQVATAAGVSLAGLYHYVKSKDELLFFIQYHTFGMLTEGLEAVLAQPAAPEAHLAQMVSNHVRYLVEHLPELKLCTTELDSLQGDFYDQVLVRRQRYFELTRQILKRLKTQDHGSRVDPNLGALYLFGMLNWIVMWPDPKRSSPEELTEFFLSGFRKARGPE